MCRSYQFHEIYFLQVCKNGRCLAEIENIIPDYSHVTETYVEAEERMDRGPDFVTATPITTLPPSSKRTRIRRPFRRPTRSITVKDSTKTFTSQLGKHVLPKINTTTIILYNNTMDIMK